MLKEIDKLKETINKCLLLEKTLGVDLSTQIEALEKELNKLVKGN